MKVINYVKESFKELANEVTWISLSEAQKSTVLVAIFTVIFAIAVFITDKLFSTLIDAFLKLF